jgi:hypothetical protein
MIKGFSTYYERLTSIGLTVICPELATAKLSSRNKNFHADAVWPVMRHCSKQRRFGPPALTARNRGDPPTD